MTRRRGTATAKTGAPHRLEPGRPHARPRAFSPRRWAVPYSSLNR